MNRCLACLALLVTLGCNSPGRDSEEALVVDLASQLDRAEVFLEAGFIDIGTPEARPLLGQGWSWNEEEPSGTTFAWSSRYSSVVHFFVAEPRPLQIRLRCKPFRKESRAVERLSLTVNGHPAGMVALRRGWGEYDLDLPSDLLQRGINQLVFEYQWTEDSPPVEKKRGKRQVAVAWDWIQLPGIGSDRRPAVMDTDGLVLPAGSQVDFYFAAPGETVLLVEQVKSTTPGGGLEITSLLDGEAESESPRNATFKNLEKDLRIPVTKQAGLTRLRFLAKGDFELSRPRVLSLTAPEQSQAETLTPTISTIPRERPSLILLYLIDTLRADHLSPYNYERNTSPGLARLMEDAVVFEDVIAHSSWTKPSTASILTGHLPWSHGAERSDDALTGELDSLAHHLKNAGYRTGAFSANGNIAEIFGFHHGFDHFSLMGRFDASATTVQQEALQWLAGQNAVDGAFLYAHTIDPHAPYVPTERFFSKVAAGTTEDTAGTVPFMRRLAKSRQEPEQEVVREIIDLYDGEISFSDQELTDLLEVLKRQDLYDQSLIMVLSDHGEEFYDHGSWTHGRTLYQEVLQVPLLIKFPGNWGAAGRVAETVQQIDILPTVLDYLEIPPPDELRGESLLCAIQQSLSDRPLACETDLSRPVFSSVHYHNNNWLSVVLGDWKLILRGTDRLDRQAKLFNRHRDPEERENIAALHPVQVGYLASLIRAAMSSRPVEGASQPVELDRETRERLEALGYLN